MSLLEPTSIAVIGASATEGKVGHDILKNLLSEGYEGKVFPVNPKHSEILGIQTYASVSDIDADVDLAVIVVPAPIVPSVLEECGVKGISNAIIISAGFGETATPEGKALEEELKAVARTHKMNVIGPNCLGILRPSKKMNASFAAKNPPTGKVALVSQSGAMAVAVMDGASELGIGFSSIVSIGNKALIDESDILTLLGQDDETSVIGLYLESIADGPRFLQTCLDVGTTKRIVLLKAGTSKHGKEAAASHTGALAGSDSAVDAVCAQSGALRARTMQEFLDLLEALSTAPVLASENIAIITNAGGPGILATDAAEAAGLAMPKLTAEREQELRTHLPEAAGTGNPIDVIGDADTARFAAALDAVGHDPNIDGVALLLTPQVMTPVDDIAHTIVEWRKTHTTMPIVTSFMGDEHVRNARRVLQKAGVPSFETPERAIQALALLRDASPQATYEPHVQNEKRKANAQQILGDYVGLLPEDATEKLFSLYGIPVPKQRIATSENDAVHIASDIGYPVIAKISSPHILHKTDIGAVRAHLLSEDDVRNAYQDILRNVQVHRPDADIRGVLIQEFCSAGNEFIVGATRDASFGHLVMAGLGGIYTELLQDTAFRIAPISENEGYKLLQELLSWKLLLGMRGQKQLDIAQLALLVSTVSHLVHECPQITDIDLNPVFVRESGLVVADAKVVVG